MDLSPSLLFGLSLLALAIGPLAYAVARLAQPLMAGLDGLVFVVMGGLVSSTVLTLLVLPALHRWFAPKPEAHHSLLEAEHVHPS